MRLAADTALHALRLLKHAQENAHGVSGPAKLAMYLPLASHPMFPQQEGGRRLEEIQPEAWVDEGDASGTSIALTSAAEGGDDAFMAALDNPYVKKITDQCHVNMEDIILSSSSAAFMLTGGDKAAAAQTMSDPTYIQNILSAFGDFDGQPTCSKEDLGSLMGSYSSFMTCTGLDALIGRVAVSGFNVEKMEKEVTEKCLPLGAGSNLTSVFTQLEESSSPAEPTQEQVMECFGSIFEDNNPVGEFITGLYENTGKYCSCLHDLGEKVPECIVEEEGMKVSMSLIKTSTCVMGVGCDAYKDYCVEATSVLEKCLPGEDEEYDCTKVMVDCDMEGAVFPALPHFVSHHLPDTCKDVAEDSTIAKFESFQEKCAGKKNFIALDELIEEEDEEEEEEIDVAPEVAEILAEEHVDEEEEEIKSEEAHIVEEEEDLKEEQEEIKEELELTKMEKSEVAAAEQEQEKETSSASLPMAGIAIVACAVVVSLVVIKKKFFSSQKTQKNDFTPVADGGFEYEEDADAGTFIA